MIERKLPAFMTDVQRPHPGVEERAREHRKNMATAAARQFAEASQAAHSAEKMPAKPSSEHLAVQAMVSKQIREFPGTGSVADLHIRQHLYALKIFTRLDFDRARKISETLDQVRAMVEKGRMIEALMTLRAQFPRPPVP